VSEIRGTGAVRRLLAVLRQGLENYHNKHHQLNNDVDLLFTLYGVTGRTIV